MRVIFSAKSGEPTDAEREYTEKRLQRLTRYFRTAREAQVTLRLQRNRRIVEVQLDLDGTLLRAEGRDADLRTAVDQVADRLEQQVRRLKERLKHHKGRADAPTVADVLAEPEEEAAPVGDAELPGIVRRKRLSPKPMSTDEAALQMELLNHDFFVFLNAENGEVGVLYHRLDGQYGLLEVES